MEFLKMPYLPEKRVVCIIGDIYRSNQKLPRHIDVISPPEVRSLPHGLCRHADLGICMVSGFEAVCPPDTFKYYKNALAPYGFEVLCGKNDLGMHYPEDTAYNVCVVGNKCFLNEKICDPYLYEVLKKKNYNMINVKQGYAKCSICPIDENTIISGDAGICRAALKYGMEVLLISYEGINLQGFENGFFGGCAGMLSSSEMGVNGELRFMKDGEKIEKFLKGKGINVINLKKGEVCDIGSVIPLMIDVHNI